MVCGQLNMTNTRECRTSLVKNLHWECYGVLSDSRGGLRRKFVGVDNSWSRRRDFVRLKGVENNTCFSAELLMFVILTGFVENNRHGIVLPRSQRQPSTNTESVEFALIRWLSPHRDSLIRDSQRRPIAPPPLDINHALWSYSRSTRNALTKNVIKKHIHFYGDTQMKRDRVLKLESDAYFGLVPISSLLHFINCTSINTEIDTHTILETITIPFEETSLDDL